MPYDPDPFVLPLSSRLRRIKLDWPLAIVYVACWIALAVYVYRSLP